ncbi:Ribosomal silencing factor RsfS [Lacunisphaera limnophila]|jgi:ribosome-associated protein|uniref:Ribosomal silencing factor RsfS n=1 Tax=Lacunisphaera limnophila TaxID=1838286 RepID=A0A1D8AUH6_9BACT|nr:ribosome silencing factor [Lacunisphaera limnophila]AOS44535.1 Ribosomal silencing factor RsfS [Lacunisphaera limnophila]
MKPKSTRKPATAKPAKVVKAAKPAKTVKTVKVAKPAKAKVARKTSPTLGLLKLIVSALDGKKADHLRVLDVSEQSSITDFLVLANGTSEPHLRALRVELEKVLDAEKARILGMDATQGSGWIVVDAFEVMVHLFTPENRDKYRMETLWRDATEVPVSQLIS